MPPAVAAQFSSKFAAPTIDEGIKDLNQSIQIKPDRYDDAMAYLNLLYRQKADLESTAPARDNDLKLADDLVDKVKAIKAEENGESSARPPLELL